MIKTIYQLKQYQKLVFNSNLLKSAQFSTRVKSKPQQGFLKINDNLLTKKNDAKKPKNSSWKNNTSYFTPLQYSGGKKQELDLLKQQQLMNKLPKINFDNSIEFLSQLELKYKFNEIQIFQQFNNPEFVKYMQEKHELTSSLLSEELIKEFRNKIGEEKSFQKTLVAWFKQPLEEKKKISQKLSKSIGDHQMAIDLFPFMNLYQQYVNKIYPEQIKNSKQLIAIANLTQQHLQYPFTRDIRRKFIYHAGPTNSGKTHEAIQRLVETKNGIYCAPLRLLAWEVQQKLETYDDIQCDLITGQEKIITEGSQLASCTVEMAMNKYVNQCEQQFDCAVLDEVQLLGDFERGSSWTSIVEGLPAKEIHVCGDPRAINIVKQLVKQCGDSFEEKEYKRRSELVVSKQLFDFKDLQPGDCLIAFSAQKVFQIKQQINEMNNNADQCAILYGKLPPQVRKQQAHDFNSQKCKYLVATDVIGMGLNFNIKRIIFTELKDRRHHNMNDASLNQLYAQIGGRAGRGNENGTVMCMKQKDLKIIQNIFEYQKDYTYFLQNRSQPEKLGNFNPKIMESFKNFKSQIRRAGIFPSFVQLKQFKQILENFSDQQKQYKLSEVLLQFVEVSKIEGIYFIQKHLEFRQQSDLLEEIGLNIEDQFIFALAPISQRQRQQKPSLYLQKFAQQFKDDGVVFLPDSKDFPVLYHTLEEQQKYYENNREQDLQDSTSKNDTLDQQKTTFLKQQQTKLEQLQQYFNVLEVYTWLHFKFPNEFVEHIKAQEQMSLIIQNIQVILQQKF